MDEEAPPRYRIGIGQRLFWFALQIGIVGFFIYVCYDIGREDQLGIFVVMGIGYALTVTVLLTLALNAIRRLKARLSVKRDKITGDGPLSGVGPLTGEFLEHRPGTRIGDDPGKGL